MEGLEKLEKVQKTINLLHSVGISEANPDDERFLADFIAFLIPWGKTEDCGELEVAFKCQLITKHISKIADLFNSDDMQCNEAGSSEIWKALQVHSDEEKNPDPPQSLHNDVAVIGIDAMMRSNSTLEDFCRSYFMFHKMDANQPQFIFRYLPMLSFTESFIYQLDGLNEKLLEFPKGEAPTSTANFEGVEPNQCAISTGVFRKDPFRPLLSVVEHHGLLTERIMEELRYGEEYWRLERKLCLAVVRNHEISIEDVTRAIHLKSFDYRVLNLLLYQLRGEKVNELHMEFLSISELLVEVSDDLFDYEDDVAENNFNVLRMFVKFYGASAAPVILAKFISEAEEKYDRLFKALDPEMSAKYQKRCEEATREGGKKCGPSLGTWHMPPVIEDEDEYRKVFSSQAP